MESIRKDETIQAVLIADTYDKNFQPFVNSENTVSRKFFSTNNDIIQFANSFQFVQSLLPLVNTPMIDYALEALNRSRVEEVFLFATNFVDEIKDHVK